MQLHYPQKDNGMYVLSSADFDPIATELLKQYYPQALHSPMPLDIDHIIDDELYLTVIKRYLSYNSAILGLITFAATEVPCLNSMYQMEKLELEEGTMVIDAGLSGYDQKPRERFTKSHECSHWILHRSYHDPSHKTYELRKAKNSFIACRTEAVEKYNYGRSKKQWTDDDWEEWQADRLAAAMLMPAEPFRDYARTSMRHNEIRCGYLLKGRNVGASISVVEEIAEKFMVSKKAVQIRLKQLGLLFEDQREVYAGYNWNF